MKAIEIIRLFNEIESKFEVDKWIIEDIHVWPLIRMDLMMNLHFEDFPALQTNINFFLKMREALKILSGIPKCLLANIRDFKKNISSDKKIKAVFLGDGVSKLLFKDKVYDKFCDPFIDYFKKNKIQTFLMDPTHEYMISRYSSSMFIQIYLDWELIKSKLFFKKINKSAINFDEFNSFLNMLRSKNLNVPIPDLNRLRQIMTVVKAYASFFEKILKRLNPVLGFVVGYYGPRGMAFNLACHNLGIKSIDIQHGVAGAYNAAYGNWLKVPKAGYELLPEIFWCWKETDVEAIKKWNKNCPKHHLALLGGNLLTNLWQSNKFEKDFFFEKNKKKNILVTLSSVNEYNKILLEKIIKIIKKSPREWLWWIRFHPCDFKNRAKIKDLFNRKGISNFDIDRATNLPLYLLLKYMSLHITYVSATVIDADFFGVPSIILGQDGVGYFSSQLSSGNAKLAFTEGDIEKTIRYFLFSDRIKHKNLNMEKIQNKALNLLFSAIKNE